MNDVDDRCIHCLDRGTESNSLQTSRSDFNHPKSLISRRTDCDNVSGRVSKHALNLLLKREENTIFEPIDFVLEEFCELNERKVRRSIKLGHWRV